MFGVFSLLIAQGSLAARVIPRPTGNNGYEEYVRAAEIVDGPVARRYGNWSPGFRRIPPGPGESPSDPRIVAEYARWERMEPLDVYREEVAKFGGALTLVAAGNLKTVRDPHSDAGPDATFPEYSGFMATTKLAGHAALVHAADGRTDLATKVLLDQLRFGDNVGRLIVISNLTNAAIQRMVYTRFSVLLPRLSIRDAQMIGREAAVLLARPPAARSVLEGEYRMSVGGLGLFLSGKVKPSGVTDEAKARPTLEAIAVRPLAARQSLMDRVRTRMASRMLEMDRILTGSEHNWIPRHAALEEVWAQEPKDEIDVLLDLVTPDVTQPIVATIRSRTQLRLLALHARLIAYRWEWGRYPERLDENDPLTGEPYVYERLPGGSVRLASKGTPETGEIELRYQAPPKDDGGRQP